MLMPPMIQLSSRLALSIVSGERSDSADRDEERAEEHHLGRQKDPHAEGGRLLCCGSGVLFFEPVPREERVIEEGLLLGRSEERISKAHSGLSPSVVFVGAADDDRRDGEVVASAAARRWSTPARWRATDCCPPRSVAERVEQVSQRQQVTDRRGSRRPPTTARSTLGTRDGYW